VSTRESNYVIIDHAMIFGAVLFFNIAVGGIRPACVLRDSKNYLVLLFGGSYERYWHTLYRPTNPHGFAVHESHDFSWVSQAAISISRFLAAVANSHRLGAKTHGFAPPSSRLVGHISRFQAHG